LPKVENLKAVRPTKFVAVPRVWEKMQEKMEEAAAKNGPLKRALVNKELLVDCTINIFWHSY
jgi:long-subunit acyl-CoA synthetase (AMP-forming)